MDAAELVDEIARIDLSLRAIRVAKATIATALAGLAVFWVADTGGLVGMRTLLSWASLVCFAAAVLAFPPLSRCERRLLARSAECRAALAQLRLPAS